MSGARMNARMNARMESRPAPERDRDECSPVDSGRSECCGDETRTGAGSLTYQSGAASRCISRFMCPEARSFRAWSLPLRAGRRCVRGHRSTWNGPRGAAPPPGPSARMLRRGPQSGRSPIGCSHAEAEPPPQGAPKRPSRRFLDRSTWNGPLEDTWITAQDQHLDRSPGARRLPSCSHGSRSCCVLPRTTCSHLGGWMSWRPGTSRRAFDSPKRFRRDVDSWTSDPAGGCRVS